MPEEPKQLVCAVCGHDLIEMANQWVPANPASTCETSGLCACGCECSIMPIREKAKDLKVTMSRDQLEQYRCDIEKLLIGEATAASFMLILPAINQQCLVTVGMVE